MPKTKILVTIKNEEEDTSYEVPAILQDCIMKYKEPNNTTVLYDYEKNSLIRENEELRMDYLFDMHKQTEGSIEIKELGQTIKLIIKTKELESKNHNIEIKFSIENKDFLYKIEEIK